MMPKNKNFDGRRTKLNEYLRNTMHLLTLDEVTDELMVELELETLHKRTVWDDIQYFIKFKNAPIKNIKLGKGRFGIMMMPIFRLIRFHLMQMNYSYYKRRWILLQP